MDTVDSEDCLDECLPCRDIRRSARFPGPAIRIFARHAPAGIGGNCRACAENPEKVPEWWHFVPALVFAVGKMPGNHHSEAENLPESTVSI
ncbi:MAG: hypothetical protein OXF73_11705 [Gammaproteobacteria bacterium]|nr:hypothetical protein [Gammaproteobacteria bacterium]